MTMVLADLLGTAEGAVLDHKTVVCSYARQKGYRVYRRGGADDLHRRGGEKLVATFDAAGAMTRLTADVVPRPDPGTGEGGKKGSNPTEVPRCLTGPINEDRFLRRAADEAESWQLGFACDRIREPSVFRDLRGPEHLTRWLSPTVIRQGDREAHSCRFGRALPNLGVWERPRIGGKEST